MSKDQFIADLEELERKQAEHKAQEAFCKNCRTLIRNDGERTYGWYHPTQINAPGGLVRCNPKHSGQPYGLDAEPVGVVRKVTWSEL
jgi:hypothetical protein